MTKEDILNLVEDLEAEHLANFIDQGIVTLEELQKTEFLDGTKRCAIQKLLKVRREKLIKEDDDVWESVRYCNDMGILKDWIYNNPSNRHISEAKAHVKYLQDVWDESQKKRRRILDNIRHNPNKYSAQEIIGFLIDRTITETELVDYCKVPQSAIDNLDKIKAPPLNLGSTPDTIPEGYTEVYFWGYKGSGKTCALGAILHMAEKMGYLEIAAGPGNRYTHQLKNIFSDDNMANDYLPAPSPVETTQYLPFVLKKPNESKSRSVSLIELSGEIFLCFAQINANLGFQSLSHENTFNSLNRFLKSNNRKVHFFFIDYDRENLPDADGMTQSDYLSAASTYFKNHEVFRKSTDAIYLVLTKSDLIQNENGDFVSPDERLHYAKQHLAGSNYQALVNTLKGICKKYSINGGALTVEPFSLGKVYFRDICNFDGTAAARLVEILMERIPGTKQSFLSDFLNK